MVKSGETKISKLYFDYLRETKEELWDSPQELIKYYTDEENYRKLSFGETGDNKLRKYRTKVFLEQSEVMFELVYAAIRKILGGKADKITMDSLATAKKWAIATRHIGNNINNAPQNNPPIELSLFYDVNAWYTADFNANPLSTYNNPVRYKIYSDKTQIIQMLDDGKRLYGNDIGFVVGRLLVEFGVKAFWSKTEIATNP